MPAALAMLNGTVLEGRYELGQVLGSGGMGAVFAARHLRLDRQVAIKVLRPSFAAEGEYNERFLREAKAASKIRHRNVVEILDYGETTEGLAYSVMEFLAGQDLEELLRAQPGGRLPWAQAHGLLVQIASGLKAAHAEGVIHRDIKPANCFLTQEDGEPLVKLVDFGIAKLEGHDRGQTLTGTAQVLGTPTYIAPEMVRTNEPASTRSDIYSLGVVAYRMLVGRVPFTAATVFELLRKACFEPLPSLREQVPEIPAEVDAFVHEMLAKEPGARPPDMHAVRERLRALGRQTLGSYAPTYPTIVATSPPALVATPPAVVGGSAQPDATTLPRDLPRGSVHGSTPGASVGFTTQVVLLPTGIGARAPAAVEGTPPYTGAASHMPMYEPPSPSPSRPGETVPSVGDATLRGIESSGSIVRPRLSMAWLGLGALATVAMAATLAVMVADNDEPAPEGATTVPAEPPQVAATSPVAATPSVMAAPPVAGSDGAAVPPTDAALGTVPTDAVPDTVPTEVPKPDAVAPTPTSGATSDHTQPRRTKAKSSGPPSDSVLLRRLEKKIAKECALSMGGGSVTVKFLVTSSGGIMGLTATGPGASCAKGQVQGTEFRTRSKSTALMATAR